MGLVYDEGTAAVAASALSADAFEAGTGLTYDAEDTAEEQAEDLLNALAAAYDDLADAADDGDGEDYSDALAAIAAIEAALAALADTDAVDSSTKMEYRIRMNLTGSGETDGGLAYSATVRLQDSSTKTSVNAIGVTVSGAFGSLTFGSESSAAEYAVGDLAGVGYGAGPGGADTTFIATNAGQFAIYSYTAGDLTVYASAGQIDSETYSVGAKYAAGDLSVGVGYEDNGSVTHLVGSAAYTVGGATTVKGIYGVADDIDFTQMGVSVQHVAGAITAAGYYRTTETGTVTADNYGVGVAYDLGGGAAAKAGWQSIDGRTAADAGLTFAF